MEGTGRKQHYTEIEIPPLPVRPNHHGTLVTEMEVLHWRARALKAEAWLRLEDGKDVPGTCPAADENSVCTLDKGHDGDHDLVIPRWEMT